MGLLKNIQDVVCVLLYMEFSAIISEMVTFDLEGRGIQQENE